MIRIAVLYGLALVGFVAVDMVWLVYLAKGFYRDALGDMLAERPNLVAAAAFYLIYPVGLTVFAIAGNQATGDWRAALMWGALFGFFAYATYDLTNLATLRTFPVRLALLDIAWGTALSGATAAAVVWVSGWILKA